MAYLPKSQIKSNLYTKGEEYYLNNQSYKGYYYLTSTNEVYTGKHPGDLPNELLVQKIKEQSSDETTTLPSSNKSFWVYEGTGYNLPTLQPGSIPTSIYPKPSQNNYKLGEFQRYFVSKVNEIKFIEVNEFTYNQYLNQDPNVSYQLYSPIQLPWELTGDREKVYEVNLKTVQRIERNLQLRGFTQYFKGRFTQFYKDTSEESLGDSNTSY